jgi:hypothetical protein
MPAPVDFLFLDDKEVQLELLQAHAEIFDLTYSSFQKGENALRYLHDCLSSGYFPRGCFSDMRLADANNQIVEGSVESLAPRDIANLFVAQGKRNYFKFITGTIDPRDIRVGEETGCEVLWKRGAVYKTDVRDLMATMYTRKLIAQEFPVNLEEETYFPLDTLLFFAKHLEDEPDLLEKACDSLVVNGFLEAVIEADDKLYRIRKGEEKR